MGTARDQLEREDEGIETRDREREREMVLEGNKGLILVELSCLRWRMAGWLVTVIYSIRGGKREKGGSAGGAVVEKIGIY